MNIFCNGITMCVIYTMRSCLLNSLRTFMNKNWLTINSTTDWAHIIYNNPKHPTAICIFTCIKSQTSLEGLFHVLHSLAFNQDKNTAYNVKYDINEMSFKGSILLLCAFCRLVESALQEKYLSFRLNNLNLHEHYFYYYQVCFVFHLILHWLLRSIPVFMLILCPVK